MLESLSQPAANDNHRDADTGMEDLLAAFEAVVTRRLAAAGAGSSFAEREVEALSVANELTRQLLERALRRIVQAQGTSELRIDGELFHLHSVGTVMIHSLVGGLQVERPTYRKSGVHNGPIVVPLELEAGLMEHATPAFAERVVMGNGDGNSRTLHRQLLSSRRVPPSRAVLENLSTRLGTALSRDTPRIEAVARRSEKLPENSATICVGVDRTSVPMEEDLPSGTAVRERKKPRVRKAPPPVEVNFRMAYVGTVALVDADGDMLRVFKYSATPGDGPVQLLHSMMQDVRRALRQRPTLRVLAVQDAGKEMWTLLTGALAAEPTVERWDELIDHPHAMSHLWAAADAIDADTGELMAEWKKALREHDDAIDAIHARIVHELGEGYVPPLRIILEEEDTYLTNNKHRLHYAALRDAGCPIGSGATEGACKSFVSFRCKGSGQRWRNEGLRAALACRTHLVNNRLATAVATLRRLRYTADVRAAA